MCVDMCVCVCVCVCVNIYTQMCPKLSGSHRNLLLKIILIDTQN